MRFLRNVLAHPLTRDLDLDSPETTELRRDIIQAKPFVRRIYEEWYRWIAAELPQVAGPLVELGSGAGFLRESVPGLVTTELLPVRGVDVVCDAQALPFGDRSLAGLLMVDVLHHVPRPRLLFDEATRCVVQGGRMVMIEPWVSRWSRLVYRNLHHEPFEPEIEEWLIPDGGPLSGANGALPWVIFDRDRETFERDYPWSVDRITPMMPLCYLISGGLSMRSLMPRWTYPVWRAVERLISPTGRSHAMFAGIVLSRR